MCGIGGYFLRPGASAPEGILDRLQAALTHRGPDGTGRFVDEGAGLVHTRLSIVDLEGGAQPFVHDMTGGATPRRTVLIANGEIYNHQKLRTELEQDGQCRFTYRSQSDCETILALWTTYGDGALTRLRGMYAAALYESSTGTATLLRDPFGIKPLYIAETAFGIVFASELAALRLALDDQGNADATFGGFIIDRQFAPDDMPAFAGIRRLAPGERLTIQNGRITSSDYDRPLAAPTDLTSPDDFETELANTVDAHLMADVPVGLFFSGGVDSSTILASLSDLRARNAVTDALLTYTVRFEGGSDEDTEQARSLAATAGAEFVDVVYGKSDFLANAGMAALACDDAAADYAILPTLHLAERASADVKVVLSGEGGDEFFAGYGRYRAGLRVLTPKFPTRDGAALRANLLRDDVAAAMRRRYQIAKADMPNLKTRLCNRGAALAQLQRHDINDWLPNDLLIKLDRCLMRHGVEGRTPFIDRRLSTYGFHLPHQHKIGAGGGKHIMKSWLDQHMPAARPFARKRGFTVPVGRWIAEEAETLAPLAAAQPGLAAIIRPDAVGDIFAAADGRGGLLAWRMLFYALWHQIHCRQVAADQPLADILAA